LDLRGGLNDRDRGTNERGQSQDRQYQNRRNDQGLAQQNTEFVHAPMFAANVGRKTAGVLPP
jgi:hypothetical protein